MAVLQAVVEELTEHGYAGASVERIATRAGVSKTTVYRRWGGLSGLLADLTIGYIQPEIPVPDEGSLDADMRAIVRGVVAALGEPAIGSAITAVVAASVQDSAAREVLSRFMTVRTVAMSIVVARAVYRGEVPVGTDATEVIQTVTAQLFYRLFIGGQPLSEAVADQAAAITAAAARAGELVTGTADEP